VVQLSKKWRPIFEAGVLLSVSQYTSVLMSAMVGAGDSSANFTGGGFLLRGLVDGRRFFGEHAFLDQLAAEHEMGSWFCL
jgi:hypothetical protein